MTRSWLFAGVLVALALGALLLVQRVERERQYRVFLASGDTRLAQSDPSGAIEAWTGALAIRPSSMVAHLRRGEAYAADHRIDAAVRDLRAAAALAPDSPAPLVALGDVYEANGDATRAADWYGQAAARLTDQDPRLLYKLALADYQAGLPAAAIAPLVRALARDDSMSDADYLLGLAYRDTERPKDAVEVLERAVRISPSLLPAREELADLYREEGRPVDEMRQLEALEALDARPDRRVDIALAEARQGRFDRALGSLDELDDATRASPTVQMAVGRVYLARAEQTSDRTAAARAVDVFDALPDRADDRGERLMLVGHALALAGDWSGAERTLHQAVLSRPVDPEAYAVLADVAEHLGHDRDARDALTNLAALDGDTATLAVRATRARRVGMLALRLGDAPGAATAFKQAVDNGLTDGTTLGLLAQARWAAGDHDGARQALASAMVADPHNASLARLSLTIR